jgi:hypothetical protein
MLEEGKDEGEVEVIESIEIEQRDWISHEVIPPRPLTSSAPFSHTYKPEEKAEEIDQLPDTGDLLRDFEGYQNGDNY